MILSFGLLDNTQIYKSINKMAELVKKIKNKPI